MHNMPKIDISHEACGVANCMSCAFNVMYVYFNSKHASSDKTAPRQHMNSKKNVKTKNVPYKTLNNVVKKVNMVNNKTASRPKARVETFAPKPKHKVVKAV